MSTFIALISVYGKKIKHIIVKPIAVRLYYYRNPKVWGLRYNICLVSLYYLFAILLSTTVKSKITLMWELIPPVFL